MYEEVEVIEKWRWVALVAMDHHRSFHIATPEWVDCSFSQAQ